MEPATKTFSSPPYLDAVQGRDVVILPYFDGEHWHMWQPQSDGSYLNLAIADVAQSAYVAMEPASSRDLRIGFIEFLLARVYSRQTRFFIDALEHDVHHMGASLEKLEILHRVTKSDKRSAYASTEIEYLFTLCRSAFDLLQEIASRLWKMVEPSRTLPKAFSDISLAGEVPRTSQQIQDKFKLPPAICDAYADANNTFKPIRDLRNGFVHSGRDLNVIFVLDEGFAVSIEEKLFEGIVTWDSQHVRQNGLASLRLIAAAAVAGTIQRCEKVLRAYATTVLFPPSLFGTYNVFLRSEHAGPFHEIERILTIDPWHPFLPNEL